MANELENIQTPAGTYDIQDAGARTLISGLDDAKFNKSNIDTSIANPTSDTKVLSEKAIVDNYFNKSNIDTSMANPTSDAKVLSEKAVKNYVDDGLAPKANKDGNYPTMTVGVSDNLAPYSEDSGVEQSKPFITQGTGTDNNTAIVTTGALGLLKEKQGNSVVVNQLYNDNISAGNGVIKPSPYSIAFTETFEQNVWNGIPLNKPLIDGHKVLLWLSNDLALGDSFVLSNSNIRTTSIITVNGDNTTFGVTHKSALPKTYVALSDLTQWFGSNDNIPADLLAHPENWYRYYQGSLAYNTGTLENANGVKLVCTQGRNLWDEVAEKGYIDASGNNQSSNDYIRSKNFFIVGPNREYYIYIPSGTVLYFTEYDANGNFIKQTYKTNGSTIVTQPNTSKVRFYMGSSYGTTYNHDITISLYYTPEQGGEGYNQYYPFVAPKVYDTGSEVLYGVEGSRDTKLPSGLITRVRKRYTFTGNETWEWVESWGAFRTFAITDAKKVDGDTGANLTAILVGYEEKPQYSTTSNKTNMSFVLNTTYHDDNTFALINNNYGANDLEAFKTYIAGKTLEYELATPTTEQGTSFPENLEISDYGMMYWLDSNDNLVGIPQGAKFFYPVDYKGFIDDVYARTNGDAQDIVVQSDLAPLTSLQNAIGGTLRQCLCVKETLDFDNTDFVDLGELTWAGEQGRFVATLTGAKKPPDWTTQAKILCSKYKATTANDVYNQLVDKAISLTPQDNVSIYLRDTTYADATTFKAVMKGVLLAYEKASE